MVECPVCGVGNPPGQTDCGSCGLPTELFEAVSDIAAPSGDPKIALAETKPSEGVDTVQPAESVSRPREPPTTPPDLLRREELPPSAGGARQTATDSRVKDATKPWGEALRIGRALGMDLNSLVEAMERADSDGSLVQLSRLRRELIRSVLDGLIDRYRCLCDRRDVLSTRVRTLTLDAELAAYRRALSGGELARAEELRGKAEGTAESIEESWRRIKTQLAEAGQMIRALRELGGVAPEVLKPVAEAIRIPRKSEAGQIERRLNRAHGLLWGLLVPRMDYEISKGRSLLNEAEAPAALTDAIRSEIAQMAEKIRVQKVGEALESRLFLRVAMKSLAPRAPRRTVRRSFIE